MGGYRRNAWVVIAEIRKLELLDIIEEMANDLYTGCIISEYDPRDTPEKIRWEEKYCQHRYPSSR